MTPKAGVNYFGAKFEMGSRCNEELEQQQVSDNFAADDGDLGGNWEKELQKATNANVHCDINHEQQIHQLKHPIVEYKSLHTPTTTTNGKEQVGLTPVSPPFIPHFYTPPPPMLALPVPMLVVHVQSSSEASLKHDNNLFTCHEKRLNNLRLILNGVCSRGPRWYINTYIYANVRPRQEEEDMMSPARHLLLQYPG